MFPAEKAHFVALETRLGFFLAEIFTSQRGVTWQTTKQNSWKQRSR
jgi:hypothetical protein